MMLGSKNYVEINVSLHREDGYKVINFVTSLFLHIFSLFPHIEDRSTNSLVETWVTEVFKSPLLT